MTTSAVFFLQMFCYQNEILTTLLSTSTMKMVPKTYTEPNTHAKFVSIAATASYKLIIRITLVNMCVSCFDERKLKHSFESKIDKKKKKISFLY